MKKFIIPISLILILLVSFFGYKSVKSLFKPGVVPTPTPSALVKLTPDQYPTVSLDFSADGRYVTVKIANINSEKLEYNLIYDATVKKNKIQTGVNAAASLNGEKTYEKRQLLGSESSGKFTYHEKIENAFIELTLRDAYGRSIFFGTYPFTHSPSSSPTLQLKSE